MQMNVVLSPAPGVGAPKRRREIFERSAFVMVLRHRLYMCWTMLLARAIFRFLFQFGSPPALQPVSGELFLECFGISTQPRPDAYGRRVH